MKANHCIILSMLMFCSMACASKKHSDSQNDSDEIDTTLAKLVAVTDSFEAGKLIRNVVCKANIDQSYALYIPAKGNKETLPVVYFFDSHGDGSYPLGKYQSLADAYNFILIGSNNSKNGNDWPTDENIWANLVNDSKARLKINDNRIYTCGFSGGGKVASYIAMHHNEIKGVIANGAGLPEIDDAGNFAFSFTAIAGEGDMNMTDLVAITSGLDKTQTRHRIIFFDGIHEWAPLSTMNIAFAGFELDAMHEKIIPLNNTFISNYIDSSKKRITAYSNTNSFVKAERECSLCVNMLDGITNEVDWFKQRGAAIKNNEAYKKQSAAVQNLLTTEQSIKDGYNQQFQNGDVNYWTKTISDVKTKAKAHTAEGAMYQRLQAYLSLAFYSISNQLIKGNQDTQARYFVDLYKTADATNTEAWYLSAVLNARSNNSKGAEDDLLKAFALGFADRSRLMQQPEFQNQNPSIDLTWIESKMK